MTDDSQAVAPDQLVNNVTNDTNNNITNNNTSGLERRLRRFTFTPATDEEEQLARGNKILETISSSSSSTGLNTPATYRPDGFASSQRQHPSQRRYSIGPNSNIIPALLNAQLNNIALFSHHDSDEPNLEQQLNTQTCLEHDLATLSTALMTKKQLGKIVSGVRNIERTLNHVNIRANIKNIMILTKIYDPEPNRYAHIFADFLLKYNPDINIFIQDDLKDNETFEFDKLVSQDPQYINRIRFWTGDRCNYRPELFDLVVSLGGDGTVLYASWLFQSAIPPVLPFSLGSLGFLTDFNVADYKAIFTSIMEDGFQCSIRMRFECTVMKSKIKDKSKGNLKHDIQSLDSNCKTHEIFETFTVFNEVVVDRGPNAIMTSIEMYGDKDQVTTAEADGLIISTPSGSTAYSLSAGGSLVHPEIPGILISPICPHTLSFRPLIIPESIILRLGVPYDARSTAWCSFDGKNRVELGKGDFITITASRFPLPFIKQSSKKDGWFNRISETLHWNERKPQKPLVMADNEFY